MHASNRTGRVRGQGGRMRGAGLAAALPLGLAVAMLLGMAGCATPAAKPASAAKASPAAKAPPPARKMPVIAPPEVATNPEGQACPPAPPVLTRETAQAARAHAQDHGFLWRITKNGHSSYLYGTMHVSKPAWMFPGPKVSAALDSADTVALELDVLDPKIAQEVRREASTLQPEPLPPAIEARLRKQAEALCVPYAVLAHAPAEAQLVELDMMFARKDGLFPIYAIDSVLAALGHAAHKHVVSLETPDFQMHLLMMPDRADMLAYVNDGLDELESKRGRALFLRMAQAWAHSDYATMARYPEWCECLRTPIERKVMRRMLNARNPRMAAKIDALHRKGAKVFAAVGSLHLFGAIGLPALMRKKGYTVERIELATADAPDATAP
jgi:uncharacterized protein YbaP (TraB family)